MSSNDDRDNTTLKSVASKFEGEGTLIFPDLGEAITRPMSIFEPRFLIAKRSDGDLYQLWCCKSSGDKEWRRVPSLTDAIRAYGGTSPYE